jgi:trehalose 6-phosphate synthase
MPRLIVVSNRVNAPTDENDASVGGLAMALSAALREYSGVWFGWSGRTTSEFTGQLSLQRSAGVTVATVDLEEQDRQEYYNGYANRTLWPLFHHRIDLSAYERSFDKGYARVNARFADTVTPLLEADDLIWVHDYHLIPLAQELRRRGVCNRIGYFLHIPWPARRLITTLPNHSDLVRALFDYDLVGFQSEDSLSAFREYVTDEIGGEVTGAGQATAFGRQLQLGAFPIGLDAEAFAASANGEAAQRWRGRMEASLAGRRLIIGVDRLDYSKGLEERFLAYEEFLGNHPDALEGVSLLQVATPSRDEVTAYQDIRARLDAVSGRTGCRSATSTAPTGAMSWPGCTAPPTSAW